MGNDGVAAVEKAPVLLDCFKPEAEALSPAALAQASGVHRTTVYRLMSSLEHVSYITRSESGAYSLGLRLLYLGKLYEQSFHLSSMMEPVLYVLAAATRESISYYVIGHRRCLCLFRAEPSESLHETRLPGTSLPLNDTAISHVLRYQRLGEVLYDSTPGLPLFTSGARDQHMAAFTTPVSGSSDKFMTTLTLSDAASQLEATRTTDDFAAKQLQVASELSRKLGVSTALCERLYGA